MAKKRGIIYIIEKTSTNKVAMEDILDYNPEFIYYKSGEKKLWTILWKSAIPLYILIMLSGVVYLTGPIQSITSISNANYLFIGFIGFLFIYLAYYVFTHILWTIIGKESVALLPESLLIRKELYRRHELVIPFKDIQEVHWHHSLAKKQLGGKRSYNPPHKFNYGKLEIRLKNGKKHYIGEDFSKKQFQRLTGYFPCYYLKKLVS